MPQKQSVVTLSNTSVLGISLAPSQRGKISLSGEPMKIRDRDGHYKGPVVHSFWTGLTKF